MDCLPIELRVGNLRFCRPEQPNELWQKFLWIVADIDFRISGESWLKENDFPVVELAVQLNRWLIEGGEFSYESMEADISLLRLSKLGGGYRVESPWQTFAVEKEIAAEVVKHATKKFVRSICLNLGDLGISVDELRHLECD